MLRFLFDEKNMAEYDKLRLEWDCRRGMLELDKIIMPFYLEQFEQLTAQQKATFVRLLGCTDLQLFSWLFKRAQATDSELQNMINLILEKQGVVIEN
ncbi:flavinator of succinate dehydrogenase [Pasteurella bettyae CCUG 2042]|uniref:FAD assembly factor SdhE n=2 Tax=Pasteurella bettyae TaxID=752 RepID=I3DBN3_9PAST|nr:flavinator of succinate dehydrogenase [Pasteurella bettyae CCUG 2042]SUB22888.1 TPR repeat protein [Pasteurella bettyae]